MYRSYAIALIAGTALIVSLPAAAQTTLWSGTLTVEAFTFPSGTVLLGYKYGEYGEIDNDGLFEYDGVVYGMREIAIVDDEDRDLIFGLYDPNAAGVFLPDGPNRVLRLDDRTFATSDARVRGTRLIWDDSGLDWSGGERISVTLSEEAAPVPALPLVGAWLLASLLGVGAYRRVACKATGSRGGESVDVWEPTDHNG